MIKSRIPVEVKTLVKWASEDKPILRFDLPIQRRSGVWTLYQKSMLVYAMLKDYLMQPIYLKKYKDDDGDTIYNTIEGKQRLTSLLGYVSGDYALDSSMPDIEIDGKEYNIGGMYFDDLDDDIKDIITGFRFPIYGVEDVTDRELEEMFEFLNNASPLSTVQKTKATLGTELITWFNSILGYGFWVDNLNLTEAQKKRENNLLMFEQSAILLDSKLTGYSYKGVSAAEAKRFCKCHRGNFSEELKTLLEEVTVYLSEAFRGKSVIKYLKPNNVCIIFQVAKLAYEDSIEPASFNTFLNDFFSSENEKYKECSGSGNVKKVNVQGRLVELTKAYVGYYNIKDIDEYECISDEDLSGVRPASATEETFNTDIFTEEDSQEAMETDNQEAMETDNQEASPEESNS